MPENGIPTWCMVPLSTTQILIAMLILPPKNSGLTLLWPIQFWCQDYATNPQHCGFHRLVARPCCTRLMHLKSKWRVFWMWIRRIKCIKLCSYSFGLQCPVSLSITCVHKRHWEINCLRSHRGHCEISQGDIGPLKIRIFQSRYLFTDISLV